VTSGCASGGNPSAAQTDKLALSALARDGIAAIWNLHVAAAEAHGAGYPSAASAILEVAEAAEDAWLRAAGMRRPVIAR
jgi:hypothetical protein